MSRATDSDIVLKFPILIGDIGGTNARFALLIDSYAEPKEFPVVQTADYATIDEAIQAVILDRTSIQPRSAVLAVAGPVDGDEIELTNCPWVVRPKAMHESLGLGDIVVLNDFEAQALAVVALGEGHMEKIGEGRAEANAGRVVLGPGTGLGVAGLVHAKHMWIPVPGEGRHIDVGPRTRRDHQIFPHLGSDRRANFRRTAPQRARPGQHLPRCKQGGRRGAGAVDASRRHRRGAGAVRPSRGRGGRTFRRLSRPRRRRSGRASS